MVDIAGPALCTVHCDSFEGQTQQPGCAAPPPQRRKLARNIIRGAVNTFYNISEKRSSDNLSLTQPTPKYKYKMYKIQLILILKSKT